VRPPADRRWLREPHHHRLLRPRRDARRPGAHRAGAGDHRRAGAGDDRASADREGNAEGDRRLTKGDRRLALEIFLLTFIAYAWFFGGGGWNQNANFDLTRAIVERHTFAIDAYADNTFDVSPFRGHIYANKAPGLSLLGCIVYAPLYAIERVSGVDVNDWPAVTLNQWLCTAGVCGISGAWLIAMIFLYARRYVDATSAASLALLFAFGTYFFAYSTVFFPHVPTAAFLFAAFAMRDRPLLAGVFAGLAVLCTYIAIVGVAILLIDRIRDAWKWIAGGALFAIVLLGYQTVCFGGPFHTSIELEGPYFKTPGAFLGVFVLPRLDVLIAVLLTRYRGLFFLSPVLILAIAGAVWMVRSRVALRELAVSIGVFLAFLLVVVSFNNWDGGSAIGPRYLLPAVPFLAVPMMFVVLLCGAGNPAGVPVVTPVPVGKIAATTLIIALAAISFIFNFAVTAVNPIPSRRIADPLFRYTFPLLIIGHLPADTPPYPPLAWKFSLGHVSVNRNTADDAVAFRKHPPGSAASEWASFNLGEIFAPGSPLSLLPIALWLLIGSGRLVRSAARQRG
jgi:hypothetical protein